MNVLKMMALVVRLENLTKLLRNFIKTQDKAEINDLIIEYDMIKEGILKDLKELEI